MEAYRIYENDASIYYFTFSVVDWLPIFISEPACMIVADSLHYCYEKLGMRINAYVIMPTHIHAILFDEQHDAKNLSKAIDAFRRFTGHKLADFSIEHCPKAFTKTMYEEGSSDRSRRFWQDTRHPVAIKTEKFWRTKFDYIHDNPRRKGLVLYPEYWRFSSSAFYNEDAVYGNDVPISELTW